MVKAYIETIKIARELNPAPPGLFNAHLVRSHPLASDQHSQIYHLQVTVVVELPDMNAVHISARQKISSW